MGSWAQWSGEVDDDPDAAGHGAAELRKSRATGSRRGCAAAGSARADRLPGGGASALWLDDDRPSGAVRPGVLSGRWNQPMVEQILDHFELSSRSKIWRLSQGQRAQVSLALAIAPDPDLLILDDPTLGLDTVARRDFLVSMIQLIQRQGRTILFSSHILSDVERVADRIGILVDGVLRVDCPTEQFKESVRKVVVEFAGRPPAFPGCQGLVNALETGNRLELVIVNFGAEQQRVIESLCPLGWDLVGLNLEDAFVAYTRGPRPSLPVFDNVPTGAHPGATDGDRDRGAA